MQLFVCADHSIDPFYRFLYACAVSTQCQITSHVILWHRLTFSVYDARV